ncbi:VWA domain-containing protein [Pseudomonas turukhanskensis]|uniref:VWFA domain-containing protein n=1 Tax=Pseudomonas turukhanskensis TaxID=1806536 RepID=A0A9W6K8H6_9PSED|nr:VWA domain-containing protein [Pseudomonas turukhanskensis]GLK89630.1 hypothetical protein GCM10017655_26920 [Pseudomonas turukhanskensis]
MADAELRRRWRLALGRDAEGNAADAAQPLGSGDAERDTALDFLYQREYQQRSDETRSGGQEASRMTPATWLAKVRKLFPVSTVQVLQRQAIERYKLTALLTDPEVLRQSTPTLNLVQTLLSFRNHLPDSLMAEVRQVIRTVCQALEERLARRVRSRIEGRRNRQARGGRPTHAALDWHLTIRRNLKHYDLEGEVMALQRLYYNPARQKQLPWDIIVLVDQSGSMAPSIIYAAVIASIFSQVRSLNTRVLLFDTQVVDVSGQLDDPVETLLAVQLGGGTDIAQAVLHAEALISQPRRSMLVLLSDFYEGGSHASLYASVTRLAEAGVSLLGLAALDQDAQPDYDPDTAQALIACGMRVAAMTPDHLADWVAERMAGRQP